MAYSVTPLVITGDSWTAGNNNTYIRDNFKAGIPDVFTAQGDIAYASGADGAVKLSIGTPRKRLMVNDAGTYPEYRGIIGCRVVNTSRAGLPSTPYLINFQSESYDTDNFWDASNPDAIIIPYDGVYHISGCISTYEGVSGFYDVRILIGPSDKEILRLMPPDIAVQYIPYNYVGYFSAGQDAYLKAGIGPNGWETLNTWHSVRYLGSTT